MKYKGGARAAIALLVSIAVAAVTLISPAPVQAAVSSTNLGGSVTEADGSSVQGVKADLFQTVTETGRRGQYLASTDTDSAGRFAFEVSAGCYTVTVIAPDQRTFRNGSRWHQRSVCVQDGQSIEIATGVLAPVATAGMGGTVRFASGDPAEGVAVDLFEWDPLRIRGQFLDSTTTGSDGTFNHPVPAGCYVLTFIAPGDSTFDGSRYYQLSACVVDGEQRSNFNAELTGEPTEDAVVSGTVKFSDGNPVSGVEVTQWATGADGARTQYLGSVYTGDDGTFSALLQPACYWLIYVAPGEQTFISGSRYLEVPLCVEPGQTVGGLDATVSDPAVPGIEVLEAQWADARREVVAEINRQGYGVTDDVLVGPGNFRVDLSQCPADWRNEPGDDQAIVIGHTLPLSGILASYGNIGFGMQSYVDYVNDSGGVDGKPIELLRRDDSFVAAQTVEQVNDLLSSVDPFAIMTLGSPNSLAVNGTLNDNCVPQPFSLSGHPGLGDPVNHPWTTGLQLSWATEAMLWGEWIKTNLADELPVKVAALVMDNNFGRPLQDGFQQWVDANPGVVSEFLPVFHEPAAPSVTEYMWTLTAAEPDVFIAMTTGNPCLLAIEDAGRLGLGDQVSAQFTSSSCRDVNAYMAPAGVDADGVLVVDGGQKVTSEPANADDPYIQFVNETLESAGFDTSLELYGIGFAQYGWPLVEALRIAAELDGGLTRANFLLAQRAIQLDHPALVDGVEFSMNGNDDAFFIEGSTISRYDAATQAWTAQGPAIDINGATPNCALDASSRCQ